MEVQPEYPIETFDPLLRDLVVWGLLEHHEGETGAHWQLVPSAQRRLDELAPAKVTGVGAVVYLDRLCADCRQRGLTRLYGEKYVCDSCRDERHVRRDTVAEVASPAEQSHFWRRSRQRQGTGLAS
jgi:hypothetical protein